MLDCVDPFANGAIERGARFYDGCRAELSRRWASNGKVAGVIGCNPSDANGDRDDPTSGWLTKWFRDNGFAAYRLWNLYPFVTSSPRECRRMADWENNGPDWWARDMLHKNLSFVEKASREVDQVFVCFGAIAWDADWTQHFIEEIQQGVMPCPALWCWGFNNDGSPKHPMARGKHRIPNGQKALLWRAA
jgi:hypothetical protein